MTPEKRGAQPVAQSVAHSGAQSGALREVRDRVARGPLPAAQDGSTPARRQTRLQKGASPLLSRPRPDAGDLARRLTERDRAILRALVRHRIFTGPQLQEMFFTTRRRASVRLVYLFRLGALDRFQPHRVGWGSYPYHYVLGRAGAEVRAAEVGEDLERAARRARTSRALALSRTQRLVHLVGINGFYAALVGEGRRCPKARLEDWMTEAEVATWADGHVRPDAFGQWSEAGTAVEFFLEYDRATETHARLVAKLAGYEALEAERGASAWVLFVFPNAGREVAVRAALAAATVPVATTALVGPLGPADAVWWPLGAAAGRLRLIALARTPIPPEAARRATSSGARPWFFARSRNEPEEAPIDQT